MKFSYLAAAVILCMFGYGHANDEDDEIPQPCPNVPGYVYIFSGTYFEDSEEDKVWILYTITGSSAPPPAEKFEMQSAYDLLSMYELVRYPVEDCQHAVSDALVAVKKYGYMDLQYHGIMWYYDPGLQFSDFLDAVELAIHSGVRIKIPSNDSLSCKKETGYLNIFYLHMKGLQDTKIYCNRVFGSSRLPSDPMSELALIKLPFLSLLPDSQTAYSRVTNCVEARKKAYDAINDDFPEKSWTRELLYGEEYYIMTKDGVSDFRRRILNAIAPYEIND